MIPAGFEYFAPSSLKEAVELLSHYKDDVKILAGGQSLVPLMKLRLAKPKYVIDLNRVGDLNYIREAGGAVHIGALATHSEIERSEVVRRDCRLLAQTAATIADTQVRNRGTLGGSLAHADPAGDMPAAIFALDAEMKASGPSGERWIKAEDFFVGFLTSALEADEILTEIKLPVTRGEKSAYLKAAQRASGFAVVGVAVRLKLGANGVCDDIAIGVTGVTDKAYRAKNVERALKGARLEDDPIERAANRVVDGIDPLEDINGSKDYRAHLARVYTARAIKAALQS
ncbi:MAG TPA: xanthine dehydrogenase family protein subunit M [Candidatus Binatia bacterium]|nr:xanthine dehydrogenase family protein subunit M [Candidatus Binatia bacterium]